MPYIKGQLQNGRWGDLVWDVYLPEIFKQFSSIQEEPVNYWVSNLYYKWVFTIHLTWMIKMLNGLYSAIRSVYAVLPAVVCHTFELVMYHMKPQDTIHTLNIANIHNIDLIPTTPPQYLLTSINIYEFLLPSFISANPPLPSTNSHCPLNIN